ncbi:MAG: putative transposase, partial [Acidimicrobiales bacterium]
GPTRREPRAAFVGHRFTDERGCHHDYLLADRRVRIPYDSRRRRFACRQITRLDEASGHQTQILTTRTDPDPASLAHDMFHRWSQENFFRYMRAHYGLDALDSYATIDDDPTRMTPNPARRDADRVLRDARRQLAATEEAEGRASIGGRRPNTELLDAFAEARAHIERLARAAKAIPAKLPLGEVRPDAVRLAPERKRIHDAVRMATYNAESALARLLAPHYPRADDEARSLLREAFHAPADLEVIGDELHVRLTPLSAPRRTRTITALCEELTATTTRYPGTNLTLVYSVKADR